ncbi:hypothetical protein NVP1072O_44 [Vibrio phage 1.072.O._10N.286.48.A12]|nr:hypothetical protein NVP1004O_43 [Vibrio phage 1.004.O._10N.261.54.A2]AUR83603.1 hypothetical protein NVP1037O_43 [Vibrio phage 1.037.O._10N.261.52.F7]AUR84488.1 hypothetical protein NVP1056O_46 [Vibrio phage 1.056.O._10N.261.48.C11]AUR85005.1 hypothetical protein NVP1066O_46 [Vibrio phage 1.066.O._10N.286.46.E8]AUR85136.1 hypothetical protein NVP1068O_46 [Vibrio phage 1.068.O._10N.261.51.F8]AUR85361.1 hypothetical protein NVP1072O_44 [Vibrio phage 1.072.O._10N.286.48.A12]
MMFVGFKFVTKHGPATIIEIHRDEVLLEFEITGSRRAVPKNRLSSRKRISIADLEGEYYVDWRSRFNVPYVDGDPKEEYKRLIKSGFPKNLAYKKAYGKLNDG